MSQQEPKKTPWEFIAGLITAFFGLLFAFLLQSKEEARRTRKKEIEAIDEASDNEIKKVVKENAEKSLETISDDLDNTLDKYKH